VVKSNLWLKRKKRLCECGQPVIHGWHGYLMTVVAGGDVLELNIGMISFIMIMPSMPYK
jgi:hypothetical protein